MDAIDILKLLRSYHEDHECTCKENETERCRSCEVAGVLNEVGCILQQALELTGAEGKGAKDGDGSRSVQRKE